MEYPVINLNAFCIKMDKQMFFNQDILVFDTQIRFEIIGYKVSFWNIIKKFLRLAYKLKPIEL